MGRNKINMSALAVLAVCFAVGLVAVLQADWDYTRPPRPAKDIADSVIAMPRDVIGQFGMSDRTTVYYNLIRILQIVQNQGKEIVALKAQVKVLEIAGKDTAGRIDERLKKIDAILFGYPVIDPNEVAK